MSAPGPPTTSGRAAAWLTATEASAFGAVSRIRDVEPSVLGDCIAGIGTVLDGLEVPHRSPLVLIDATAGTLRTVEVEPAVLAWAGDTVIVGGPQGLASVSTGG